MNKNANADEMSIYVQEEPYQLRLFSKSPHAIEVLAADFLPDGQQLYLVAADADGNIHVLQFDPEGEQSIFLRLCFLNLFVFERILFVVFECDSSFVKVRFSSLATQFFHSSSNRSVFFQSQPQSTPFCTKPKSPHHFIHPSTNLQNQTI